MISEVHLRCCDALNLLKHFRKVSKTDHSEAGQEGGGPARGFQLGPAQVEFPPRQRLHRVVVGADQFQVTTPYPVPVIHPSAIWSPLRHPWSWGPHGYIQLTAHGT